MAKLSITHDVEGILRGRDLFRRAMLEAMVEAARRTVAELQGIWPVDTGVSRDQFGAVLTARTAIEIGVAVQNLAGYASEIHVRGMVGPLAQIIAPTYDRHLTEVLRERDRLISLAAVSEVLAPLDEGI